MKKLKIPLLIVGLMWIVFLVMGQKAIPYGILPRHIDSLRGILFAPFIHVNLNHIMSNTLPIFLLTWALALFYERFWFLSWVLMTLTANTLLWFFGREAYQVGASVTIFALIGFFLASGIFRRQFKALIIAVVIGFLYGGALYGILPSDPHISWEGHLFGLLSGIFWAYIFRKTPETREKKEELDEQKILDKNIENE